MTNQSSTPLRSQIVQTNSELKRKRPITTREVFFSVAATTIPVVIGAII